MLEDSRILFTPKQLFKWLELIGSVMQDCALTSHADIQFVYNSGISREPLKANEWDRISVTCRCVRNGICSRAPSTEAYFFHRRTSSILPSSRSYMSVSCNGVVAGLLRLCCWAFFAMFQVASRFTKTSAEAGDPRLQVGFVFAQKFALGCKKL